MRRRHLTLVLILALIAALTWTVKARRAPAAQRAAQAPRGQALEPGVLDGASLAQPAAQGSRAAQAEAPRDDLPARLMRFAQVELEIARAQRADDGRQAELERLLQPTLEQPAQLHEILEHLVARTWHVSGASQPSLTELGGVRFLYWCLLLRHTAGSPIADRAAGRELFLALASVLPELDPALRELLLGQVLSITVDGRPLALVYAADLMSLRARFREHRALYSALLAALGDAMTPAERQAFFGVLLVDESDPVLVATALRNLLQGTQPALALALARELFDGAAGDAELQRAVAQAVVEGAQDPFLAAEFLEQRAQALRNAPAAWLSMASREDGFLALEAGYERLLAADADARARALLVMGMRTGRGPELERVARIALEDSDPGVRGQALLTWTSSSAYQPRARDVGDLRDARARGTADMHVLLAAENIARAAGGALRADAVDLLREIALDPAAAVRDRRRALGALQGFLSAAQYASLQAQVTAETGGD